MASNKLDIQIQSTQIKTSTAAGTAPPGGGIIPTLLDCPPYFKWEAFKDENGNPTLRPPSLEPPPLFLGDWDGDGFPNNQNDDAWWWFPFIRPPHPNDIYGGKNSGSLHGDRYHTDPERPEQNPDLEGTPSYQTSDGFDEDKYNQDYKFWEDLYNANNPLYANNPSMFPNGWPCWRCKDKFINDQTEPSIPSSGGDFVPIERGYAPPSKKLITSGIDCDEFRKNLEDYLRRTNQSYKKPRSSSMTGSVLLAFRDSKWKYYNCLTPTQGTRHPDAPPIKLSDYPWWGKPWHELTPEQRELIPSDGVLNGQDLYKFCSTYCKEFKSKSQMKPVVDVDIVEPVFGQILDHPFWFLEAYCQACKLIGEKMPIHPLKPPRSPFVIPEEGTSVPSQYQEGQSIEDFVIPEGSSPTMIPSNDKWKYFDDWGGWWELELPSWAPVPFTDTIPGWFPNGEVDLDWHHPMYGEEGYDSPPSGAPDYVFGNNPGYPVPCRSAEWDTPISSLPQNTNGPFGMTQIIGPNGNPIESTDTIYQSDNYIVTEIKQKPIFNKTIPTILGTYSNLSNRNSLLLLDKNINNYNKKMNILYKWKNRFS